MRCILVVEDDAINAMVFRRLLEKRGPFRVIVTEQGDEVLALTRSGEVDLVVMDVSLARTCVDSHRVNGVELCGMLKQDPATAAIPVLIASAHAMRGDAERLTRESGADGYVPKPIVDHDAFVRQVTELLRKAA